MFYRDLAERILMTFLEVWIALLIASGLDIFHAVTDLSIANKAVLAVLPTTLALVKGALAKGVGDRNSASLAPEVRPPSP